MEKCHGKIQLQGERERTVQDKHERKEHQVFDSHDKFHLDILYYVHGPFVKTDENINTEINIKCPGSLETFN